MTNMLDTAVVYDVETFPNAFILTVETFDGKFVETWEISAFRDDRADLMEFLHWVRRTKTLMIGFNNVGFDYPIIHFIFNNPNCTVEQIYEKAMSIINDFNNRFGHTIWPSDRITPQMDLFKIHHMDNHAKSTSLKALQINMRSKSVVDMPVEVGTMLTKDQIDNLLIPYNRHDVAQTKQFTKYSIEAINFRMSLIKQFGYDVLNWSDTKIGSKMMEQLIGEDLCYDRTTGRKQMRQTPRTRIVLGDIIFPYVKFKEPEFKRIHDYLSRQILCAEEIDQIGSTAATIKTKGVFTNLKAQVGGLDFCFGTGGIHGSVLAQRVEATDEYIIRDIDVASLYPSIAIVNKLAPEHLGEKFTKVYSQLPLERKKWQKEKGKKCVEANTLKLASNGVYGNSNNAYSVFYDPQFTMTITLNGQLMLCMLAERLLTVPTLKIIQINTDGITYYIHRDYEDFAIQECKEWEKYTDLVLEDTNYKRIWTRDVNSYIAESMDGTLKTKGAYWTPDEVDYHNSIGAQQPAAWHKDLGNIVSIRAAIAAMVQGIEPEAYIRGCKDPYDFMCRIKVRKSDNLFCGTTPVQKTSRYYVSTDGADLIKTSPPTGTIGAYKKKNGVSDMEYTNIMTETGGQWDERVCTKNKSKYVERTTNIQAGNKVTLCNNVKDFDFDNVDYEWYVKEAKKLII